VSGMMISFGCRGHEARGYDRDDRRGYERGHERDDRSRRDERDDRSRRDERPRDDRRDRYARSLDVASSSLPETMALSARR
jgi:hypothetical protein